jgi:hypothetical protein
VAAVAVLAAGAAPAAAEGGQSISGAPVVAYGIHETGNTANGGKGEFHWSCGDQFDLNRNSFWQLPVTVGDHVTVDWGAVILDSTCLTVYPIGTNDFGLQAAKPEESTEQGSNGKEEMKFAAPASGNLILDFAATELYSGCTDCAGPYDFTALLQHALQASLSTPTLLRTNSTVTATVSQNTGSQVPNGLVFWLLAKWYEHGERQTYEATAGTLSGVVSFPLALPLSAAGHNVTIEVGRAEDAGYTEVLSNPVTARAEWPAQPRHHRHRHHRHHRHRHHRHHR